MVYIMIFEVDGGCRRNGQADAIGAAAVARTHRHGSKQIWTQALPDHPTPTNQRAELIAIITALRLALDQNDKLHGVPYLDVTIKSDSKYAVNCMNIWICKWASNGWLNASGRQVANMDLLWEASCLDDQVKELGDVTYEWIPREDNEDADMACNEALDEQER